jgi:transcriptional regulator with XRE-family HTH domain
MRDNVRAVRGRVGARVRHFRRLRELSQERLAELVGNTPRYLGQVERGEVNVSIDVLTKIAARLSVDVAEFFRAASDAGSRTYTITQRDFDELAPVERVIERIRRTNS